MNNINEFEAILLVDDDPVINMLNSKFLRRTGFLHKIWKFESGEEAFNYLSQILEQQKELTNKNPVLVLLDLNMPIYNGWDFLKNFENLNEHIKSHFRIVVLSSSCDGRDIDRANLDKNVHGYIIKPFSIESIDAIEKFFTYS
ncbi:response regulator of citrate/malate metabolism [Belliella baltica DSM 15883]|uniref:Response regulator of citrate/malate metabolism n=1 Tax=Belliella baltica (strain DSM 15883 / CIP 108006 / LMG 21964 / BA134) TaxID=866536 RepID=I3Z8W2_BELBD|nr:response regulator [Belliella baltica]AFL85680.1 response regulator of citrate/malate metabolism [Belliella baltica DSM 15883]